MVRFLISHHYHHAPSSLKKHTARAHYVAKIWKQATLPLPQIDSFVNHGWLADGSIDWIDAAFQEEIESLFVEKKVEGDDDFDDVNELEDDDNLEEKEDEADEGNENE